MGSMVSQWVSHLDRCVRLGRLYPAGYEQGHVER